MWLVSSSTGASRLKYAGPFSRNCPTVRTMINARRSLFG